ncbi:MAG: phosphate acyltransferase PlsX [Phycisphaerae bacterium]|nr:phosphate acyltransferase PlsX [Phycisphaerae bacterium]
MRIGMDAMGGDYAPREIIRGVQEGLRFISQEDEIVLYGQKERVAAECRELGLDDPRVTIEDCPQVVEMGEGPVEALRHKRQSSVVKLALAAGKGRLDAVMSAGNTGAFAAACQLKIGPIDGVSRPGIAVVMPTFCGPVLICDVGANLTPKPHHLYEYAHICVCYSQMILGVKQPRIGLVSIGEEEGKGNPLVKEAGALIREDASLQFIGNVEGRDIFGGACEIAVCDGFVGNVILKLTEGLAEGLFKTIVQEIKEESHELLPRFEPVADRIWKRHDFAEYGGAPLLGINSVAIICHGRSDHRAINNAIRVAVEQFRHNLNRAIAQQFKRQPEGAV